MTNPQELYWSSFAALLGDALPENQERLVNQEFQQQRLLRLML